MQSIDIFGQIGLNHYLILSALLFVTGMAGVLLRRNIIVLLMSIELMLNAVNISFIAFGKYMNQLDGQILVFFVMTIAAAEAAVGLAIAVNIFKRYKEVNIRFFEHLKG
ncbi:MAG: NADH-quinone oxidoreductase subunit NuoK [Bdellovibrionaceae bacterium]|nr:NADH-quinone oxidoreductase subunit NuoK [Pseudobdellovibrionaceae bacterium]